MINIVLAEDHKVVRESLNQLLQKDPEFNVVAQARNGKEIIDVLQAGKAVDVILTDLNMPVMSGPEVIHWVQLHYPAIPVVILSALDNDKYVMNAFKLGACGYLLKSVSVNELHFAIKHVAAKSQYVCSEITMRYLNRIMSMPPEDTTDPPPPLELTVTEVKILSLLADGFTRTEIAAQLFTSESDIEVQRQKLKLKTGARNTAALVKFAFTNNYLK